VLKKQYVKLNKMRTIKIILVIILLDISGDNYGNFLDDIKVDKTILKKDSLDFPGSFAFIADSKFFFVPKLKSVVCWVDSFSDFFHSNVTFLKIDSALYIINAKHIFNSNLQIEKNLSDNGFLLPKKKDLVITLAKKDNEPEHFIDLDIFPKRNVHGVSCYIQSLNFFDNDTNIYKYKIYSKLYYLLEKDKRMILSTAKNGGGKNYLKIGNYKNLYLARVPNEFLDQVKGLSGSGVIVLGNNSKKYFFGIVSGLIYINPKNKAFILVQKIEVSDLK
jgi:hypothetical protein